MFNRTNSMKSIRLAISLIVMTLLICSCGGEESEQLAGEILLGRHRRCQTFDFVVHGPADR